ncbi:hypothetical protein D3C81_623790 [compost metagenome]
MAVLALPVQPVQPVLPAPLDKTAVGVSDKVTQGYLSDLVFLDVLSTSVVPI